MSKPTILYYGPPGLEPSVLSEYFAKMDLSFVEQHDANDLLAEARVQPLPIVILSGDCPQPELTDLVHRLRSDPNKPFPRVFILYAREPIASHDSCVTLMTGQSGLRDVADYILLLASRSRRH